MGMSIREQCVATLELATHHKKLVEEHEIELAKKMEEDIIQNNLIITELFDELFSKITMNGKKFELNHSETQNGNKRTEIFINGYPHSSCVISADPEETIYGPFEYDYIFVNNQLNIDYIIGVVKNMILHNIINLIQE